MIRGVIVPTLTFLDSRFKIDLGVQKDHTEELICKGVDGIFIMGSAGEGVCLRDEDKTALTEKSAEFVGGRVALLAGVSQESLPRVKSLLDRLKDYPVDAFVVTLPYYFPINDEEEIKDFFNAVADHSPRPIFAYNIPCFTKVCIRPEVMVELSSHPNIAGVKDSHGDLAHIVKLIRTAKKANPSFRVLIGEESLVASIAEEDFDGIIPIYGNIFPDKMVRLFRAVKTHNYAEIIHMQGALNEGKELLSLADSFFAALKGYLSVRRGYSPTVVPPARTTTSGQLDRIREFFHKMEGR